MGKVLVVMAVVAIVAAQAAYGSAPPTVTNVTASQRTDGSKLVDIWFWLSDPDSATVAVRARVSNDGGNTYNIVPVTVTGDTGYYVPVSPTPAQKQIVWDAGEDMPYTFGSNYRVAVTAHDCVGYTGEMVTIAAGPFLMGNNGHEGYSDSIELPQHEVQMSEYQIGKYEVTRGEYRRFMLDDGYQNSAFWSTAGWSWRVSNNITEPVCWAADQNFGTGTFTQTDAHPVVGVSYYEAEAFCNWATACLPEAERSRPYHLPTEAQWEKAARWVPGPDPQVVTGGTPRTWPWGDVWDAERCNNKLDHLYVGSQTAPVGSYTNPSGSSPYGCKDMAGNVMEWCKDWYSGVDYSQTPPGGWVDPQGPTTGAYRVLRDSGWNEDYSSCFRCAYRGRYGYTHGRYSNVGFRLAR